MKYTSLFSAVAVAAAMGTSAFATVTTNDFNSVNSVDFQDAAYTVGAIKEVAGIANLGWDVENDDTSSIIAAPLTAFEEVEGYTGPNKLLKLNTEGQELKWAPTVAVTQPKSLIEMKVKLVASETAPGMPEDATVHAAVYLQADENNPAGDGLYAYTASGWQQLDTSELTGLTNGSTIALRVLMNYKTEGEGARTATYEAALITEGVVGTYYVLGTKSMANPSSAGTQGHLASISFKGTGCVDDLFVSEIAEADTTANIIACQYYSEGDWLPYDTDGTVDTEDVTLAYTYAPIDIPSGKVAVVTVCDESEETLATLDNVIDEYGQLEVSCNDYNFEAGESYYIRVQFVDPAPTTYKVTFISAGNTFFETNVVENTPVVAPDPGPSNPGNDFGGWYTDDVTFQSAYNFAANVTSALTLYAKWTETPAVTGVEFGTFAIVNDGTTEPEFTAFSVSGTTATATLKAKIVSTGATATQKKLYAKYTTTLGSTSYSYAEATVTAQTAGDEGSVTVSFTLPAGDSAFFVGFTNENE